MIMNPMEMTLTKDHVKVLLHIIPKTEGNSILFLPPLDTMEHYKYCNEICEAMKSTLVDETELVANSSIKRHIKKSVEIDTRKNSSLAALSATPAT